MRKGIIWIFAVLAIAACTPSKWTDRNNWFESGKPVNENFTDVFYLVSTDILSSKDDDGNESYISRNNNEEREAISGEMAYAREMFGDSLNFFSPFYRQFTLNSLGLPAADHKRIRKEASDDAADAFRYYIRKMNNGRPFILAGFSQGSMHLIDILKEMKPREYKRMVAAYSIGYRLSAEDLKNPHIKAAMNADDKGVTISFNSVASTDAIWDVVSEDAATCINPVNGRTDGTPASITFEGDTLTVRVDTVRHVLIVESPKISQYRFPILETYSNPGNLHHWDLLFYKDHIRQNALHRAYE